MSTHLLFIFIGKMVPDIHWTKRVSKVPIHVLETVKPGSQELWDTVPIYIELAAGVDIFPGKFYVIAVHQLPDQVVVQHSVTWYTCFYLTRLHVKIILFNISLSMISTLHAIITLHHLSPTQLHYYMISHIFKFTFDEYIRHHVLTLLNVNLKFIVTFIYNIHVLYQWDLVLSWKYCLYLLMIQIPRKIHWLFNV